MVVRAAELGYPALAITDHDGLHGAMEFARAARAVGIAPITGAELTLTDGSHLTLLAETRTGYANLCRLIPPAHHAAIGRPGPPTLGGERRASWGAGDAHAALSTTLRGRQAPPAASAAPVPSQAPSGP